MQIDQSKKFSEFFDKKNEPRKIEYLVMHHIEGNSADDAISLLKVNSVSAHYMIDEQGKIFQLVDDNDIAWHAGTSFWRGCESLNKNSIGIEFINSAPFGKKFEDVQMRAGLELCKMLMEKHGIKSSNVVGHSDIAYYPMPFHENIPEDEGMATPSPEIEAKEEIKKEQEQKEIVENINLLDRKQDPSHFFDWKFLAENGVGNFAQTSLKVANDKILFELGAKSSEIQKIKEKLAKFGYRVVNIDDEFNREMQHLVRVFNRHFNQEKFFENSDAWYLSSEMILQELLLGESGVVRM